ncbi:methylenetetrahydrofolate--tRNA-(uracil(54)-C(5))-methyltransferase (FADH(2)-oxidizing) TrmFO [Desulfitibacter alkalitolerans]|uniref:methylenetetrahydrofolate--tRNA-(uracil(54)- C(5))-methyltransferase (FADH(2)-oxidizing) TrmFO n=1 Tax=Desulfitibacter alkalitolerans TaxID=264641 RepID=UPI00048A21D2|nr:methylenetetrahydrofolate--tRNA-(uracil(54)-C(5))-methyltransferase (FADH(2)-oxidizing) TrmFO [Desulfitibacter alkalitolerans]
MLTNSVMVVGGGLAGSEAAWQLAERGVKVILKEMRPIAMTPAHKTDQLAELVCSNSLRADSLDNAVGILKEELRMLKSLIIKCADETRVPAGGALAVDRDRFSRMVTEKISSHENIEVSIEEVKEIPNHRPLVIASGPLTSDSLAQSILEFTGSSYLHFYDAAAPIVTKDSIDMEKVYWASRYDKGEAAYLNCPMTEEEYKAFYDYLVTAEVNKPKVFEKEVYFEGCMPVEVMAKRGFKTLIFGPLKPVGLINPKDNTQPYAVVQLRKDNMEGTLFNLVGFQTSLKWGHQEKLIRLIPGLEKAEIVRYGVIHKNTFINSPELLKPSFQLISQNDIFFAGQITGVEGYVESTASGLVAGINCYNLLKGKDPIVLPTTTAIGALSNYITRPGAGAFQPMNVNFGLFSPLGKTIKDKKLKKALMAKRAMEDLQEIIAGLESI